MFKSFMKEERGESLLIWMAIVIVFCAVCIMGFLYQIYNMKVPEELDSYYEDGMTVMWCGDRVSKSELKDIARGLDEYDWLLALVDDEAGIVNYVSGKDYLNSLIEDEGYVISIDGTRIDSIRVDNDLLSSYKFAGVSFENKEIIFTKIIVYRRRNPVIVPVM